MISIEAEELVTILEAYAHELSHESYAILRQDWHVGICLKTVDAVVERVEGLAGILRERAPLFCLTYEDIFLRPVGGCED